MNAELRVGTLSAKQGEKTTGVQPVKIGEREIEPANLFDRRQQRRSDPALSRVGYTVQNTPASKQRFASVGRSRRSNCTGA